MTDDDLTALLERTLRDYKAIDSADPSGTSHLGLDDADYRALAARLADEVRERQDAMWGDLAAHIRTAHSLGEEHREAVGLLRLLVEAIPEWGPESRQASEESIAVAGARAYLARRKEASG